MEEIFNMYDSKDAVVDNTPAYKSYSGTGNVGEQGKPLSSYTRNQF